MATSIKVPELTEQDLGVQVTDYERDLSSSVVQVYAYANYTSTPRKKIGETTGDVAGSAFIVPIDISDLEPEKYDVEIVADDLVVYPDNPNENITITIVNNKFND